ncbi:MAG TPA: YbaB/EbfC family nucleoid-associated protein [Candidatus Dojkabacteria bacterium]|jgi:DNA-binding YbaB/EbfC family protein|nr:YbaB/EbfC family nucleoid-associated protein [Candidatus Dojkabacteria bacterium]HQC39279.1 YbaB/EbfC family nucleoid-associated protein [Candidatus Dojkabacteria bacterium]HRZ84860.1 YbaB/EbfC family nucleoid-associated protein [Candidatus Dojkabacteria bacterium]
MGIGNPIELLKMQSEAKKMQNKLRERKIKGESKNGMVRIYMNGAQEFEDIYIDDAYLDPDMSDEIKKGMKEAFKDYQKKLQKEMIQDVDLDQLKSMFGK